MGIFGGYGYQVFERMIDGRCCRFEVSLIVGELKLQGGR